MKFLTGKRAVFSGVVVVGAVAVGGLAYASIPDADGVIHACYNPSAAALRGGTPIRIIDSGTGQTCANNSVEITWNQTGPAGAPGQDGEDGLDGQDGADGQAGADGQDGLDGQDGSSAAYTNYGDGNHDIGAGLTQTVASVTVPAGSYTLSGVVTAIGVDDGQFLQCNFVAGSTVNGLFAVLTDVTLASPSPIFLRCNAQGGEIRARGQMIATQVNAVTPSV